MRFRRKLVWTVAATAFLAVAGYVVFARLAPRRIGVKAEVIPTSDMTVEKNLVQLADGRSGMSAGRQQGKSILGGRSRGQA
jgi:hypothetical protein